MAATAIVKRRIRELSPTRVGRTAFRCRHCPENRCRLACRRDSDDALSPRSSHPKALVWQPQLLVLFMPAVFTCFAHAARPMPAREEASCVSCVASGPCGAVVQRRCCRPTKRAPPWMTHCSKTVCPLASACRVRCRQPAGYPPVLHSSLQFAAIFSLDCSMSDSVSRVHRLVLIPMETRSSGRSAGTPHRPTRRRSASATASPCRQTQIANRWRLPRQGRNATRSRA